MRVTLQSFKTLTYNVNKNISVDVVEGIHTKLCSLLHEFREQLPQDRGLLIRPQLRKELIKSYRSRFTSKRLNLLPKCTARKKRFNAKYRGRVGKKANILRKVDCRFFELKLSNTTLQAASQTASHSAKTHHAATKIQQKKTSSMKGTTGLCKICIQH